MDSLHNAALELAGELLREYEGPERVCAAWPLAAGGTIARRTRATSFSAGALTVAAPDRAWQQQLAQLRPQLQARLSRLTGVPVTDILFFVERKHP
jgi:predicted nucleic acid-binding Zn ribbon protein